MIFKIFKFHILILIFIFILEIVTLFFLQKRLSNFEKNLTKNLSTSMPHIIIYTKTPKNDYKKIIKNLKNEIEGINIFYYKNLTVQIKSREFRRYNGEVKIIGLDINNYPIGIDISSLNSKELLYYSIRLTDFQFLYMMENNKFIFINEALNSLFSKPLVFQSPFYINNKKFIFDAVINDKEKFPVIFMSYKYFKDLYKNYNKGIYIRVKNLDNIKQIKLKLISMFPNDDIKLFFEENQSDKKIMSNFKQIYIKTLYFIVFFFTFISFLYLFFASIRLNKTINSLKYLGYNTKTLLIYSIIFLIIQLFIGILYV